MTGSDLLTLGAAVLLCIAVLPSTTLPFWTATSALLAIVAGPGLLLLLLRAWGGDRVSQLMLAFLAWAVVSAASSPTPGLAVVGDLGTDRGVLHWVRPGAVSCS